MYEWTAAKGHAKRRNLPTSTCADKSLQEGKVRRSRWHKSWPTGALWLVSRPNLKHTKHTQAPGDPRECRAT